MLCVFWLQRHGSHRAADRRPKGRPQRHLRRQRGAASGHAHFSPPLCACSVSQSILSLQIRPEQVCTPTDPGPVFIVVECPGEEFVGSLCTNQTLKRSRFESLPPHACLLLPLSAEVLCRLVQVPNRRDGGRRRAGGPHDPRVGPEHGSVPQLDGEVWKSQSGFVSLAAFP